MPFVSVSTYCIIKHPKNQWLKTTCYFSCFLIFVFVIFKFLFVCFDSADKLGVVLLLVHLGSLNESRLAEVQVLMGRLRWLGLFSIWSFISGFFIKQPYQDGAPGGRKQKLQEFLRSELQNLHTWFLPSATGRSISQGLFREEEMHSIV